MKSIRTKKYTNAEAVDIIHQVSNFYVNTKKPKDYGTGDVYTAMEVHILEYIANHPGITVTEIAADYARTKGAISQILKKLEERDVIKKETDPLNENKLLLYVTEKGEKLDRIHRSYDEIGFGESINPVKEMFSEEEVNTTFRVLETWLAVRRNLHQERIAAQKQRKKEELRKKKQELALKE